MMLDVALVGPGRFRHGVAGRVSSLMEGPLYEATLAYATKSFDVVYLLIPERGLMLPEAFSPPLSRSLFDLGPTYAFLWAREIVATLLTRHPITHLSLYTFASPLHRWPIHHYLKQEVRPYWSWRDPLYGLGYRGRLAWFYHQEYLDD